MFPFLKTVRARLTLWNVLVMALVFLTLGTILRLSVARSLLASTDSTLRSHAVRHRDWWGHTTALIRPAVVRPASYPLSRWRAPVEEQVFELPDRRPRIPIDRTTPWDLTAFTAALQGETRFTFAREDGKPLRVYTVPLYLKTGKLAAIVQIAYSMEEMNRTLANLDRMLLTLIPVGLAACWVGGLLMTGRMLRPVREVTRAAGQISAQDLSQRLKVSGQDEFSELAETFNGMLARLETSFEQQRRFTADASHELRTPLTVVQSVSGRFLARPDLPEEYRKGMVRLDMAARLMSRLVQDLLLLARSDTGRQVLPLSPLPLSEVVEEAILCSQEGEGAEIRNEISGSSLCVLGERSHLIRLFSNLLDNALRYTPSAGTIRVSAQAEGPCIVITVADTGIGIAAEHLPHVTERFYRTDASRTRAQGGFGLGLAICRGIVEDHGGRLSLSSELGKGTTVSITLLAP